MATPLRHLYATPAECARSTAGPIIAHDFKQADAADCYKNGLSMVGTVPVRRRIGAIYSGVNGNYWRLNNVGGRMNKSVINVVIELWPDFAADDGLEHYIYDTTGTDRYLLLKTVTNTLSFGTSAGTPINIALASYQSYWTVGSRIVFCGIWGPGLQALYMNANLLGTSAIATPTIYNPTIFYIGTRFNAISAFSGKYGSVKIFTGNVAADLFTAADAMAYWKNEI